MQTEIEMKRMFIGSRMEGIFFQFFSFRELKRFRSGICLLLVPSWNWWRGVPFWWANIPSLHDGASDRLGTRTAPTGRRHDPLAVAAATLNLTEASSIVCVGESSIPHIHSQTIKNHTMAGLNYPLWCQTGKLKFLTMYELSGTTLECVTAVVNKKPVHKVASKAFFMIITGGMSSSHSLPWW